MPAVKRSAGALIILGSFASGCFSVDRTPRPCGDAAARYCDERCPRHLEAGRDAREGRCEQAVGELCRAQCAADCGDRSAAIAARIAELDDSLERDCGSGRTVRTNELGQERRVPTRASLDQLLEK